MLGVNLSLKRLLLGLVIGCVIGSVVGLTETNNELTKEGRINDWRSSEEISSSSSSGDGFRVRRSAIDKKALLWPNSEVPYVISDKIDKSVTPLILEAIDHYHLRTCIRFITGTAEEFQRNRTIGNVERNFVEFIPGSKATECYSPVGMTLGSRPLKITLGSACTLEHIVHEIGHLLGLLHEQSRADRDANVIIQWNDIKENMWYNFEKSKSTQWLGPYDLSSVMHYTPETLSSSGKPVFTPIYDPNVQDHDRKELSFYDEFKINKLYQCANHCDTEGLQCENGGYLNRFCQCVCPKSLVGKRCQLPVNAPKCGKVIELHLAKKTITSLNFPSYYPPNISCTWLIKAPVGFQILMSLDDFDIGCEDSLEIRHHYIGIELKPRSCVNSNKLESRSVTSTTNRMILNFQSNSADQRSGFRAAVKATPSPDCASNLCKNNATCRDVPDIETYFCECQEGWLGKNCELEVKDGQWSSWTNWSGCNAECGYEDRWRDCGTPPENGGRDCKGRRKETRRCSEDQRHCRGHFHCDFGVDSNQRTCGIVQETVKDQFDWKTLSQHRSSLNGDWFPLTGHTTRDPDDVFFHMDGKDGQTAYQKAIFWLPRLLAPTGRYCLQFFYHMTGRWTGMLNVVRVTRRSQRVIWQASGNRSNVWNRANINVLLYDGVQIGFLGIRGDGADCDIAIDDISLSPTGCYVSHFGQKVFRVPKTYRSSHVLGTVRAACSRGQHHYHVGNVSYVEGCSQYICHCNHDGTIDCPSWLVKDICTKSPTP